MSKVVTATVIFVLDSVHEEFLGQCLTPSHVEEVLTLALEAEDTGVAVDKTAKVKILSIEEQVAA